MYEKWKKKRKREINTNFDHDDDGVGPGRTDTRNGPNFRHNTKIKSELRDVSQIRKLREERDNKKVKNMSKGKRKSVLDKRKKK